MNAANRVIINTLILYGRIVLTAALSLYSVRLILEALGATDYGIFQLVGGIIALLAFLKDTMATATQRFLSFFQGKDDIPSQQAVFANSFWMHVVVGLILTLVLWALEFYLFDEFLNIPDDRIPAAKIVYRMMLLSLFFSVVNVPFIGSLIAHENLIFVAIINVMEAILKLIFAFIILYTLQDQLILYSILISGLSLLLLLIYALYCFKSYPECKIQSFKIDRSKLKELGSFAGWNLFGSVCAVSRNQGLAIVLNLFYGAAINAAYGIANQVGAQVTMLSVTMLRAINPQIMKSEGADNRNRMLRLSMIASKFGFFLVALFVVPIVVEMPTILAFWLKEVPEFTVMFARLFLIAVLINQVTVGLQSALQATGQIKWYQITTGSIIIFTLPLAYLFLYLDFSPGYVYVAYMIIEICAMSSRLYFAKSIAGLQIKEFAQRVLLKEIVPLLVSIVVCLIMYYTFDFTYRFIITGITSGMALGLGIYLYGLCPDEKEMIHNFAYTIKKRINLSR